MGLWQKFINGVSRFMYGRNGYDQLSLALLWTAVVLNVVRLFLSVDSVVGLVLNFITTLLLILALLRMFSRNLPQRRAENAWFLQKIWWPVKGRLGGIRRQSQDKDHKYFTCPGCGAICRVPRGKGKIVITCPRCGRQIHGRS